MKKRTGLLFLLFAVVVSAATFQVVDPRLTDSNSPKQVDFSDPPAQIVTDLVINLNRIDHTYTVVASPNRSSPGDEEKLVKKLKVENTDQEYVAYGTLGKNGTKIYGNDAVTWARSPNDGKWHLNTQTRYAYPADNDLNPFDVSAIEQGHVTNETSTRIVIRINSSTLKGTDTGLYTLFYINKKSKHIEKAVEIHHNSESKPYKTVRFYDVNNTTIERPNEIGFSLIELITDLARYNPA